MFTLYELIANVDKTDYRYIKMKSGSYAECLLYQKAASEQEGWFPFIILPTNQKVDFTTEEVQQIEEVWSWNKEN